jgi:hypothetical protein
MFARLLFRRGIKVRLQRPTVPAIRAIYERDPMHRWSRGKARPRKPLHDVEKLFGHRLSDHAPIQFA